MLESMHCNELLANARFAFAIISCICVVWKGELRSWDRICGARNHEVSVTFATLVAHVPLHNCDIGICDLRNCDICNCDKNKELRD